MACALPVKANAVYNRDEGRVSSEVYDIYLFLEFKGPWSSFSRPEKQSTTAPLISLSNIALHTDALTRARELKR